MKRTKLLGILCFCSCICFCSCSKKEIAKEVEEPKIVIVNLHDTLMIGEHTFGIDMDNDHPIDLKFTPSGFGSFFYHGESARVSTNHSYQILTSVYTTQYSCLNASGSTRTTYTDSARMPRRLIVGDEIISTDTFSASDIDLYSTVTSGGAMGNYRQCSSKTFNPLGGSFNFIGVKKIVGGETYLGWINLQVDGTQLRFRSYQLMTEAEKLIISEE